MNIDISKFQIENEASNLLNERIIDIKRDQLRKFSEYTDKNSTKDTIRKHKKSTIITGNDSYNSNMKIG